MFNDELKAKYIKYILSGFFEIKNINQQGKSIKMGFGK